MTELTPVELKKKKSRKKREWKERNGAFFGTTDEFFDDVFNRYIDLTYVCIDCKNPFKSLKTKLLTIKKDFDYKIESNVSGFMCRKCYNPNKWSIQLHKLPNLPFEVTPIYRILSRKNWLTNGCAYFETKEDFERLFIRYCYSNKCDYSGEIFKLRRDRCAIFDRKIKDKPNFIGFVKHSNIGKFRTKMMIE